MSLIELVKKSREIAEILEKDAIDKIIDEIYEKMETSIKEDPFRTYYVESWLNKDGLKMPVVQAIHKKIIESGSPKLKNLTVVVEGPYDNIQYIPARIRFTLLVDDLK